MLEKIHTYLSEIDQFGITNHQELEKFRLHFLSKKGIITELFDVFKTLPSDQKKIVGQELNKLKQAAEEKFKHAQTTLENLNHQQHEKVDVSLPDIPDTTGSIHPLHITQQRIIEIFERIGFNLSEGPEIEDDWHNFTALNFPPNHPARDMQDTFFIEKNPDIALRTHTSSVQIQVLEKQSPPVRTLALGRVYRNEAISARSNCFFHQIEGFYIDQQVSFKDLKQTLYYFAKELLGKETQIRLRPSYFPFTEPSVEMDVSCNLCSGKGCNVCKYTGWLEIAGSGMIHPNVLRNCKIDSDRFSGFAFGMGIERITMMLYQIHDLRLFVENDIRFLRQFKSF